METSPCCSRASLLQIRDGLTKMPSYHVTFALYTAFSELVITPYCTLYFDFLKCIGLLTQYPIHHVPLLTIFGWKNIQILKMQYRFHVRQFWLGHCTWKREYAKVYWCQQNSKGIKNNFECILSVEIWGINNS